MRKYTLTFRDDPTFLLEESGVDVLANMTKPPVRFYPSGDIRNDLPDSRDFLLQMLRDRGYGDR
ncbi:MAG: hypothetical protein ABIJ92_04540 [Candidatus Aenigmatarchaeota archaeon]